MRTTAVWCLLLAAASPASDWTSQTRWTGSVTLDFDTIRGAGCVDATGYLRSFGVTVTQRTPGTVVSAGAAGQCFHTDVVVPSSPNALYVNNNRPVSFTLNFDRPLSKVSFGRARLNAGPGGVNTVGWQAIAFDGAQRVLALTGEPAGSAVRPNAIERASFSLEGRDIRSITFGRSDPRGDNSTFGVSFPSLDDFRLEEDTRPPLPPPMEPAALRPSIAPVPLQAWIPVAGPDRAYTVTMPPNPAYNGSIGGAYYSVFEGAEFGVMTVPMTYQPANPRATLEQAVVEMAPALLVSGTWPMRTWTTVEGAPAVDATGLRPRGGELRAIFVLKDRQLYFLTYEGPRGTTHSPNAEHFFSSFRIPQ